MGTPFPGARPRTAREPVSAPALSVVSAGPEHAVILADLFARSDVACHCRYWHFAGSTNAWLDRCANARGVNHSEMRDALDSRSDEMSGVVALDGTTALGWLKLSPAASVPKIYEQRLYRRLPCFDGSRDGVFTVGCLLVDPVRRKQGVAEALLRGAIHVARSRGGTAIEAFPRRAEGTRDEDVWTGPYSLFFRAGFEIVHDFAPYPVVRLRL
jgi:GNAT superfamily N-acetyltransferase